MCEEGQAIGRLLYLPVVPIGSGTSHSQFRCCCATLSEAHHIHNLDAVVPHWGTSHSQFKCHCATLAEAHHIHSSDAVVPLAEAHYIHAVQMLSCHIGWGTSHSQFRCCCATLAEAHHIHNSDAVVPHGWGTSHSHSSDAVMLHWLRHITCCRATLAEAHHIHNSDAVMPNWLRHITFTIQNMWDVTRGCVAVAETDLYQTTVKSGLHSYMCLLHKMYACYCMSKYYWLIND
jgi:hypothetical protein